MGKKVTEDEVHAAIDDLIAHGQEATCRAVLEKTGGSMSTVIKYMATCKASRSAAAPFIVPYHTVPYW